MVDTTPATECTEAKTVDDDATVICAYDEGELAEGDVITVEYLDTQGREQEETGRITEIDDTPAGPVEDDRGRELYHNEHRHITIEYVTTDAERPHRVAFSLDPESGVPQLDTHMKTDNSGHLSLRKMGDVVGFTFHVEPDTETCPECGDSYEPNPRNMSIGQEDGYCSTACMLDAEDDEQDAEDDVDVDELARYEGATVLDDDGEEIAEILDVFAETGRRRFRTHRYDDDKVYVGLAEKILQRLDECGYSVVLDETASRDDHPEHDPSPQAEPERFAPDGGRELKVGDVVELRVRPGRVVVTQVGPDRDQRARSRNPPLVERGQIGYVPLDADEIHPDYIGGVADTRAVEHVAERGYFDDGGDA